MVSAAAARVSSVRRTHWGALLFTAVLAVAALAILRGPLTMPIPSAVTGEEADDQETAAPLDMRTPLPEELHSRWYTQSTLPPLAVGESAHVTLQFINTGHVAWVRSTPSEIRLGEVGSRPLPDEMKVGWPLPDRPAVQSEAIVYQDQVATFTFQVTGAAPGTYRLRLRPVVDGVKWLDDDGVYIDIVVRPR